MREAKEIIFLNNDWISVILFIILVLLAVIKYVFNEKLLHTSTFFLSKKYLQIYFNRDKNSSLTLFQFLFFLVQSMTLGLLFYFINLKIIENSTFSSFQGFLLISSGVLIYFGFRFLTGMFLAYIFSLKPVHKKIMHDKINYFNNLIIWILPFIFIISYVQFYEKQLVQLTLILFFILLLIRYSLFLLNNKKLIFSNLFYFIMYLCTLEIAPLIIILKLTI